MNSLKHILFLGKLKIIIMKKITLALLFLATSLVANSQTITQSTAQTIGTGTIACNTGNPATGSSDNRYFRAFDLSASGITTDFIVNTVQFGIQSLSTPPTAGYPVIVKLYGTTATFPAGFTATTTPGYTLLGQATYNATAASVGTIVSVPLVATVPAGNKLVLEVGYAANTTSIIFIASNAAGQSGPSYILAPGCGLTTPGTLASINFPDVHLVFNVIGTTLGINDNKLNTLSVYPNPSKGLFNVSHTDGLEVTKATVTDIVGKQIVVPFSSLNTIDLSAFSAGIYVLNLETSEGSLTRKLIVE